MEAPAFAAQGDGDCGMRKPHAESAEESQVSLAIGFSSVSEKTLGAFHDQSK